MYIFECTLEMNCIIHLYTAPADFLIATILPWLIHASIKKTAVHAKEITMHDTYVQQIYKLSKTDGSVFIAIWFIEHLPMITSKYDTWIMFNAENKKRMAQYTGIHNTPISIIGS